MAPPDSVAALEALGQMCIISPSRSTVVVRFGSTRPGADMATGVSIADDVWRHVAPMLAVRDNAG